MLQTLWSKTSGGKSAVKAGKWPVPLDNSEWSAACLSVFSKVLKPKLSLDSSESGNKAQEFYDLHSMSLRLYYLKKN